MTITIPKGVEIRTASLGGFEYRAGAGVGGMTGYASVFSKLSQNLGGFVERVEPGAFDKSLADAVPVMARYNHDDNYLLGTTEGGTLALEVDGTGLRYDIAELPNTSAGRDVAELARRGDLRYSSFAFRVMVDDWDVTEQGFPLRILRSVQLVDVAPVNNPAYRDTTTGLRSLADRIGADVGHMPGLEEIRARLTSPAGAGGQPEVKGQGETHPYDLELRIRQLELHKLRP